MAGAVAAPTTIVIQNKRSPGVFAGVLGCLFAVLGVFTIGPLFIPIAVLCGLCGLLMGIIGKSLGGVAMSMLSLIVSGIACLFSPTMWIALGVLGLTLGFAKHPSPPPPASAPAATVQQRAAPTMTAPAVPVATDEPAPSANPVEAVLTQLATFNATAELDLKRCPVIEREYQDAAAVRESVGRSEDGGSPSVLTATLEAAAQRNAKVLAYHPQFARTVAGLNEALLVADAVCKGTSAPGVCSQLPPMVQNYRERSAALAGCLDNLEAAYDRAGLGGGE